MDQVLHGSARTTPAVRQAIQASTDSLAKLAIRYGLNEKTVAKWRGRTTTHDAPMGPKNPASTVLSPLEEAAALTFRQHTHLPLDDCLYALQESIPHRSRSALHRLFQRHGVSQLPVDEAPGKAPKKAFKAYPVGYFHVDFTELRLADGKLYLICRHRPHQQAGRCRVASRRHGLHHPLPSGSGWCKPWRTPSTRC